MRLSRYGFGKTLTWLGILAWAPYAVLTIGGESPPFLPYLAAHLLAILGGAWIRRRDPAARHRNSLAGKTRARKIGSLLTLMGAAVWVPYFIVKDFTSLQVDLAPFLLLHLGGVVPGLLLRVGLLDWVRTKGTEGPPVGEPTPSLD